ncbi:MAG: hypothetical protein L0H54_13965 [Alcaligenaceae bacterium]|nr:hypothetical protein [Alcaligenaceae bacterium]
MEFGLLNLLFPFFGAVDHAMATLLPAWSRLALWALVGAVVTMFLYRFLSPQKRIGRAKREARAARVALNRYDGDFAGVAPLMRRQFVTAFKHIGLVLPSTLICVLPLLSLLLWLETSYGHTYPPAGQAPEIQVTPAGFQARWDAPQGQAGVAEIAVLGEGKVVARVQLPAPVTGVARHQWWNWLAANPAGYLPDDGPIQRVHIALPSGQYLPWGPDWARSWLMVFIPVMFVVSLSLFRIAKIE